MFLIRKKDITIKAISLSNIDSPIIQQLIKLKKIIPLNDTSLEVFSKEVLCANSTHGEIASKNDYIRLDSDNSIYPIDYEYFINNYHQVKENEYKPNDTIILAWDQTQKMEEEIIFLIKKKGLVINKNNPLQFFQAPLFGTIEAADINSKILLYSVERTANKIIDISFNFITDDDFKKTYEIIGTSCS